MTTNLSHIIRQNCINKSGNFNNRCVSKNWWAIRGLIDKFNEISTYDGYTFSEKCYRVVNGISNTDGIKCPICNKFTKFVNYKEGYRQYCSLKCSTMSSERNDKIKNNKNFQDNLAKNREILRDKFKTENHQEYLRNKKLQKYGTYQNANNTEKYKQTMVDRYGVSHVNQLPHIKEKRHKNKILRNDNYAHYSDMTIIDEYNSGLSTYALGDKYGVTAKTINDWIKRNGGSCQNQYKISLPHYMIMTFLDELDVKYTINDRSIDGVSEVDIYLPDFNLAIEVNGVYYHSEAMGKDKYYHLNKKNACKEHNIKLIQFWDYEILKKTEIVKSIIKHNLRQSITYYGRHCYVNQINKKTYKDFLTDNHLHGYRPASLMFGLFNENDSLLQVVGISKSRYDKKYDFELIRSCTLNGFNVVGGLSKLIKKSGVSNMVTYCDMNVYDGKGYAASNFRFDGFTPPNYSYVLNGKIFSREMFQKHKLKDMLLVYDNNLTEAENMRNNGFTRIWNCGNMKYVYEECK